MAPISSPENTCTSNNLRVYVQDSQVWYSVLLTRLGIMSKNHGRWLCILLAMLYVMFNKSHM